MSSLSMRFGRCLAVRDVSLQVGSGDSLALWGANGAGKTTLIRCVLGLLRFRGGVSVCGHDVRGDGKAARRLMGYVPQELGFYDEMGVGEAIGFFSRLKGLRRADPAASLRSVGLDGQHTKRVRELSGGMKQRLALALALLGDPPILILDEVTASLDALGRDEFIGMLKGLSCSGRTLLFASHRLEEVATLARRVAVMDRGVVIETVATNEFVAARAAEMRGGAVLHLTVPESSRDAAVRSLRELVFAARLNGSGLLVPVPPERKAMPFRVLADARIPVEDFELVDATEAASLADHAQENVP